MLMLQMKYRKSYESHDEEMHRFKIFMNNNYEIKMHNARHACGNETYDLLANRHADLTAPEFGKMYHGLDSQSNAKQGKSVYTATQSLMSNVFLTPALSLVSPNEADVDWRKMGAVTPVKNQGELKLMRQQHY